MLYWPHIMCLLDQTCHYWLHATCHYRRNFTNSIWHRQSVRTVNSILGGSRVCPLLEVSRTVMILVRTMADVTFRSSGTSRILRKSELCTHVVNYTYIYKQGNTFEVQNTTQRNVTGSSMKATFSMLSPNSNLSLPACHYTFISRVNFRRVFKNVIIIGKFIFKRKFCVTEMA